MHNKYALKINDSVEMQSGYHISDSIHIRY